MRRKIIRDTVNQILHKFGMKIIPEYEIAHMQCKYDEAVNEITNFFQDIIFKDIPRNNQRTHFISKLYGTQLSEAMYLIYYLHLAINKDGEVCEFGCANGATSALLANEIKGRKKQLWLYDSFEGLSKPSDKDRLINDIFSLKRMEKYEGAMKYAAQTVKAQIKEVGISERRIKIIPGFIDSSINHNLPKTICFAYIDFDLYDPIIITLRQVNSLLSRGGYIVVDDYDFFSSGVKEAVDEFMKENHQRYKLLMPAKFAGHFCILEKI